MLPQKMNTFRPGFFNSFKYPLRSNRPPVILTRKIDWQKFDKNNYCNKT